MNKDKQIEEMKQEINTALSFDCSKARCLSCEFINEENCEPSLIAKHLCDAGYRKASDVAREIFEEIEKSFIEYYDKTITYSSPTLPLYIREAVGFSLNEMFMKIAELKKKYTEREKDNGEI